MTIEFNPSVNFGPDDPQQRNVPALRGFNQNINLGELLGRNGDLNFNVTWDPRFSKNTKREDLIQPDSELGKKIAERQKELERRRTVGAPNITEPHNQYDDYVPVYEENQFTRDKKLVGYRPKTEMEKQGFKYY